MEGYKALKCKHFTIRRNDRGEYSSKFVVVCRLLLTISLLVVSLLIAQPVDAATLYPAPSSGSYNVGDTITVGVYVSSEDQAMNAVSGVLNTSLDKLEIVSITPGGSIINLWVREPVFSASAGSASFEGIVLNPGFTGSGGRIIVMTLKAIGPGIATVSFDSGVVLANDGNGTNILRGMGSAQFTINGQHIPAPPEPGEEPIEEEEPKKEYERPKMLEERVRHPVAPIVISETHPNQDAWYAAKDVKLSWAVTEDIKSVRLLVSRNPDDTPTVLYDTSIDYIELTSLDDGAWYIHVQTLGSEWSDVTHFRFQIDTQAPEAFELTEIRRDDATDPVARFDLNATDTMSGIEHYNVLIDGQDVKEGLDGTLKSYGTPILAPGDHTIVRIQVINAPLVNLG